MNTLILIANRVRALQYILEGLISAQYSQFRPRTKDLMRTRISQMQLCRRSQRAEHYVHEQNEAPAQPVVEQLPQVTKQIVDNVYGQSIDPIIVSIDPEPAAVPTDDETYLHYFDAFMNTSQSDEIGISIPDGRSLLFSHSNSVGFHERNTSISTPTPGSLALSDDASVSFSGRPGPTSLAVIDDPLQSLSSAAFDSSLSSPHEHAASTESFLLNDTGRYSPLVAPFDLETIPQEARCSSGDLGGNKQGSSPVPEAGSSASNRRSDNRTVLNTPTAPSTHDRELRLSGARPGSDLRAIVDGLSNLDFGERRLIEDTLTVSSISTSSRHSRSVSSIASSGVLSRETRLMKRIRSGPSDDEDIASFINGNLSIDTQNEKGETALHLAVKLGKVSATRALLEGGADVHKRDRKGRSVLIAAERVQRLERENDGLYARIAVCMALAIDAGAVAPVTIHHNSAPLRDAARSKYYDGGYFP